MKLFQLAVDFAPSLHLLLCVLKTKCKLVKNCSFLIKNLLTLTLGMGCPWR
jgi:hypothetical protein